MEDIKSRENIEHIINTFYEKVKDDDVLGYIFNDIAKVNWQQHLPVMYSFWDFAVLGNGNYSANMMTPHFALNDKIKLLPSHFERWLKLFNETIDTNYTGENAEVMKKRAHVIAETLKYKLGEKDKLNIP